MSKLIKDDGKHATYCDGKNHRRETYWGIGNGSRGWSKCNCKKTKTYKWWLFWGLK